MEFVQSLDFANPLRSVGCLCRLFSVLHCVALVMKGLRFWSVSRAMRRTVPTAHQGWDTRRNDLYPQWLRNAAFLRPDGSLIVI